MSRISKKMPGKNESKKVTNFMGGASYTLSPLETLKMVASSSMFGEPKYYQKESNEERLFDYDDLVEKYSVIKIHGDGIKPSELMIQSIEEALNFDFGKTLDLALELRKTYNIRFVPQLIMVKAALHSLRPKFDNENPGKFKEINLQVMQRADEPAAQLACFLWLNDWKKNSCPSILKRCWKARVEKMSAYEMSKYKEAEAGLINLIRICHAKGDIVADLMSDGKVDIKEDEKTWENLRSAGKTFMEIIQTIHMPHMALLRNLRNILKENPESSKLMEIAESLKKGVKNGKQFPFRYYAAMQALKGAENENPIINDALEECIDIATDELPKLKGKTMCLSDNSGSAWGAFTSEYGSNQIAVIDNLNSVIAARQSDEGYVGVFGDDLKVYPVSKRNGVLTQADKISEDKGNEVGHATENGIWLFFKKAIENKEWYDNIFIFSDQQAGHGGLYGTGSAYRLENDRTDFSVSHRDYNSYIDVMHLLEEYRSKVNPKVNFFTVQTAGYSNAIIPEFIYRGAVLYGWTGKETQFAAKLIEQWDDIEAQKKN